MMKSVPAFKPFCLIVAALLAASCSNPLEDARITLCKDIVSTQILSPVTIESADAQVQGRQQARVSVKYSADGRQGQALCYYDYDAVDDTAQHLSDPLSAFSTSPAEVVIDGRKLSRSERTHAVKDSMLKQGREFIDRAKKEIDDAIQR